MPVVADGHVLVARVMHTARTVQRVVTAIGGTGHAIEDLQYRRIGSDQGLLVAALAGNVASRNVAHLCQVVVGTVDVLWAQPLSELIAGAASTERFCIDAYEVAGLFVQGQVRMHARATLVIDGTRCLGAGEGEGAVAALVNAVQGAAHLVGGLDQLAYEVLGHWSRPSPDVPAIVVVGVQLAGRRGSAVGVGSDELQAAVRALETMGVPASIPVVRRGGLSDSSERLVKTPWYVRAGTSLAT